MNDVLAQTISGCGLSPNAWQTISLQGTSGERTLTINYNNCSLDVKNNAFLGVDIQNQSNCEVAVEILYRGPWPMHVNQGSGVVAAGEDKNVKVVLTRLAPDASSPWHDEFSEVRGLAGKHVIDWRAFDLDDVRSVEITVSWQKKSGASGNVKIKTPKGTGLYSFPSIRFSNLPRPLVDEMGQLKMESWTNKLSDRAELTDHGTADLDEYQGASFNEKFSQYGGFKGVPKRDATGYFRTEKIDDKWWLVDPEGYLFWSQGVTGAGKGTGTSVMNRQSLFPDFAEERSDPLWTELQRHMRNNQIDFYSMNIVRKYGSSWRTKHADVTAGRLKTWGINTYGAWSELPSSTPHPFTYIIHPKKDGIGSISKLPDPFSQGYRDNLRAQLQNLAQNHKTNPWLVGIFINNELYWNETMDIPTEVLALDNSIPARKAMEDFLLAKYSTISALNTAWGSNFDSFGAINGNGSASFSSTFTTDMIAYLDHFADTYYRITAEECHAQMPNHLYIGSRLHEATFENVTVHRAASRHCDVVSFNIYKYSLKEFDLHQEVDKPCIIGEFHFGTASHGVWGTGLRSASDLENQADLYKRYIHDVSTHPNFVGAHWFQWTDQMVTGRGQDGENFRIGLVNVTDQAYSEMVGAIQESSEALYEGRLDIAPELPTSVFAPQKAMQESFGVYPNPNNGEFYIDAQNMTNGTLKVYSLTGKKMYENKFQTSKPVTLPTHLKGIFQLVIQNKQERKTSKIIIGE